MSIIAVSPKKSNESPSLNAGPAQPSGGSANFPSSSVVWARIQAVLLISTLGFFFSGLHYLKSDLFQIWKAETGKFRWIVLVQGETLQIDEVGRFLKQLEGVESVIYHSPEQGKERIQNEALFFEDLRDIPPSLIPASWEIRWNDQFDPSRDDVGQILDEILGLPSVLDVALNEDQWHQVQRSKLIYFEVRLILALGALLLALFGIVFVARALFFGHAAFVGWKSAALLFFQDGAAWAIGWGLAWLVLGRLSPYLLFGGLVLFLFHLLMVSRSSHRLLS